jgi:hypothetical protein
MGNPTAFISYSYDTSEHKDWVMRLASDLRGMGVDVTLDRWDLRAGQDVGTFMQSGITQSDRVVLVCSHDYVKKSDEGIGGVGYEKLIVSAEVVQAIDTTKFIPVIRNQASEVVLPKFLGRRRYIDFRTNDDYARSIEELAREIHGMPLEKKPALGANPFSGELGKSDEPARAVGPTGVAELGKPILSDTWFATHERIAKTGLDQLSLRGFMELRLALHSGINKSQIELRDAVKKAENKTFGWPIAAVIENHPEFRPQPIQYGVRAEISILSKDRTSYDYWAAKQQGDFYFLGSLFEDARNRTAIFFNTRIVRITEALLFAGSLYDHLGVPAETRLSVRVTHGGLTGRKLSSSSSNRIMFQNGVCSSEESDTELIVAVGTIRDRIVDHVIRVAEPLFMLFDFAEFERSVYEDIIRKFINGQVT